MSDAKRKTKGSADSVDVHVGQRLRVRRSLLGMSQEKLAEAVDLTFQQIQKYERGVNRISAGRLYQFGKILGVPLAYFFEHYGDASAANDPDRAYGLADSAAQESLSESAGAITTEEKDLLHTRETLDLIRVYYSIDDPKLRKDLFRFVKSMAQSMGEKD